MTDIMMYYQDQIDLWEEHAREELFRDATISRMLRQLRDQNAQFQRVMFAVLACGEGLTLKHSSLEQWVVLLPDASHPGKFRYQQFDTSGFIGHSVCNSLDEAALEAFRSGYAEVVDGEILVRLSATQAWQYGQIRDDLIRRVNSGQLSHKEAERQYEALAA